MSATPTILYVENNPDDVFFLRRAMEKAKPSFELKVISTVEEAEHWLAQCRAQGIKPALILLDLLLNESHTGTELVHWVHEHPEAGAIPIIVLSGDDDYSTIVTMYREGAQYFLSKPFSIGKYEEIVKCLDVCLAHEPYRFDLLKRVEAYRAPITAF